jgi:hypothetical protein
MAELGRVLGVAEAALMLVEAVPAQWRDSSLGCPERGKVYTAVTTPGFRVTLSAGRGRYSMHVAAGRAVLCGTPPRGDARDGKIARPGAAAGLQRAEQARAHLATRLKLRPDQIVIDVFRPTTWPDARLGCPSAGDAPPAPQAQSSKAAPSPEPPPQPTRGFLIELSAAGTKYEYHADLTRIVACAPAP